MCTNICSTHFIYSSMFENCFICIIIYIYNCLQVWYTHSNNINHKTYRIFKKFYIIQALVLLSSTENSRGRCLTHSSCFIFCQILDVERMLAKSATPPEVIALETPQQAMENHPVIRTLYDHNGVCR
jgi:hypothetical protein